MRIPTWVIVLLSISALALIGIGYFVNKKIMVSIQMALDIKETIKKVLGLYDIEIVKNAERLFRLETDHFSSNQFQQTFSPGMEVAGDTNGQPSDENLTYPYGWHGLADTVWTSHPEYKPIGLYNEKENTSILRKASANPKYFIKFGTFEASFMSICEFLKNHNNNAGRWFSLDTSEQKKYNELISQIKPAFTNEVSN